MADFIDAKVPDAVRSISELSDAVKIFSNAIDAYAACLRSQSNPTDQYYMLEAWELIRTSLCKLDVSADTTVCPQAASP